VVPLPDRLVFQCVHADDVASAYRLAATSDTASGAFNIAADPVIGPDGLAALMRARRVRIPERPLRAAAALTFKARLQPAPPGWVDMGLAVPTMDVTRARETLGWQPRLTAAEALHELLEGLRHPTGAPTPPLDPHAGGPGRIDEIRTGVGARLTK
jgi:nucleoside-diphosphate-sugar epimerase